MDFNLLNPLRGVIEKGRAHIYTSTFFEKMQDTFWVFAGSGNPTEAPHAGVLDILLGPLGAITYALHWHFCEWLFEAQEPAVTLSVLEKIALVLNVLNLPKYLAAAFLTLVCVPFIALIHGVTLTSFYQNLEEENEAKPLTPLPEVELSEDIKDYLAMMMRTRNSTFRLFHPTTYQVRLECRAQAGLSHRDKEKIKLFIDSFLENMETLNASVQHTLDQQTPSEGMTLTLTCENAATTNTVLALIQKAGEPYWNQVQNPHTVFAFFKPVPETSEKFKALPQVECVVQ